MNYGYDLDGNDLNKILEHCKSELEKLNMNEISEADIRRSLSDVAAQRVSESIVEIKENREIMRNKILELQEVAMLISEYQDIRKKIFEMGNSSSADNAVLEELKLKADNLSRILTGKGYPPIG